MLGVAFTERSVSGLLVGDVNGTRRTIILRSIVGLSTLTKRGALNAEVDGDGSVTAADAAAILRYVVGLINIFPAQQP